MAGERVLAQVGLARLDQGAPGGLVEPAREQRQVAPVGGERVGGEAFLDPGRSRRSIAAVLAGCIGYSSVSFCAATTFL
jgi:hypothetical protein